MSMCSKLATAIGAFSLATLISACSTTPSQRFAIKALSYGLTESTLATSQFDLTIFTNKEFDGANNTSDLHIYLGGDGQPFFRNRYINPDPTSHTAVTLELVASDTAPSIYIGRPCYHNNTAKNCDDAKWWTTHRYSSEVVQALKEAISRITTDLEKPRLTLIGFSGGGTLAALLAFELTQLDSLITINPNLNTEAWTSHHGYSPLDGSINPYTQPDLPDQISKHYLIGGEDSNVISAHWLSRFETQANTMVHLFEAFDHNCCWQTIWPKFLNELPAKP